MILAIQLLLLWCGGVTDTSAVIVARFSNQTDAVVELRAAHLAEPRVVAPAPARAGDDPTVARFEIDGLQPDTTYTYRVVAEGLAGDASGTFRTLPPQGAPASFRFAFASCASTGSTHRVFARILEQRPLFYLMTGDIHYEDIAVDSRDVFRDAYGRLHASPTQTALYRGAPLVYVWDDHDFGPNGSNRLSPSRSASHATYRELVPHHRLASPEPEGPIAQAFTVGRVRFLVLDCRSQRDPEDAPDDASKTMLGSWQTAWLQRELLAGRDRFPLTFIVSSVSWVSDETTRRDNWGRYTAERAALSDWMVDNGIAGVCFLSGDAHMLAADDGRNNRYGTRGGTGFPALQAASLDRGGSRKGGPWSVEPVLPAPGEGFFGLVEVEDDGASVRVLFRGLDQDGAERLRLAFTTPAPR